MRKLLALILCLGAWPFLVGPTGCASHRSNPSPDQRIEDNRTAERVREALAAAPKYRYDGVQVAVARGVVQLSGSVNTQAQKNGAGQIVTKLAGVHSVQNNLTVKD